jgi:sugar lactone lactonase YvrE
MLALTQLNIYQSKCSLGEGLLIRDGNGSWVDINSNSIFVSDGSGLLKYKTTSTPSIVFEFDKQYILFGSDSGFIRLCRKTGKEQALVTCPKNVTSEYRSNDGGSCGGYKLLSFMHRRRPDLHAGYVYVMSHGSWSLLDDSIYIPNTFVEIDPSNVLISDSYKGEIWLFELDINGAVANKKIWAQLEPGIAPDGGCLVGDYVLISLWDGEGIGVFTKVGELIKILELPVLRPTNCKYDIERSTLWLTSAQEGLTSDQLVKYPNSGNTFVFNLELL